MVPFQEKGKNQHALVQKMLIHSYHLMINDYSEPNLYQNRRAEVWVRVDMDIDSQISLVRNVQIMNVEKSVELEFKYKKLQKFCTTCRSLRHMRCAQKRLL